MIEIRCHTYFKKASIVHVDRRMQFKQKLLLLKQAEKQKNADKDLIGKNTN